MTCLDERRLLELHFGDASAADHTHVATCSDCAARLQAMRRDLGRVDAVLRATPPRMRPRPVAWRWAPVAVAAMLALAVAVHRQRTVTVVPEDDTVALADELATTMVAETWFDDDDADRTETGRSTCTWGDPLLEVGCDEPAVMRIAWR
jgi:hypothetical protein